MTSLAATGALHRHPCDSIIALSRTQSTEDKPMPRTIVYRGRKIQVAVDEEPGAGGQTVRRDVVLHPGAVAVLPLVDADHVCLLRNHRPAIGDTLWEIPAGTLEPGEPVADAAVRELAEETGYRAGRWQKLLEFFPSPGVLSERTHLFAAHDLTAGAAHPEADEQLEPHVVPWSQALAWALDGTIRDAKTLVALLYWERVRGSE
jgi:ADP-ribose pyrophosphatase